MKYGVTIFFSISSGLIHRQHTQETVTLLTAERQTRWVDHQHDDVSKGVNITAKSKDEGLYLVSTIIRYPGNQVQFSSV